MVGIEECGAEAASAAVVGKVEARTSLEILGRTKKGNS